jgi:type I restriction enzyme M protein
VETADVDQESRDLSVRNPNTPEAAELRSPQMILDEIAALDAESARVLARLRELL